MADNMPGLDVGDIAADTGGASSQPTTILNGTGGVRTVNPKSGSQTVSMPSGQPAAKFDDTMGQQPVIHWESQTPESNWTGMQRGGAGLLDNYTQARDEGYSWGDIDTHLAMGRTNASAFGYSDQEIDNHLGYTDPSPLLDRLKDGWSQRIFQDGSPLDKLDQPTAPNAPSSVSLDHPDLRDDYARALLSGETKGPADFVEQQKTALGASLAEEISPTAQDNINKAAKELQAGLPDPKELVDASIGIANATGADSKAQVASIRAAVMKEWADTGQSPTETYQKAIEDPEVAQAMAASGAALPMATSIIHDGAAIVDAAAHGLEAAGRPWVEPVVDAMNHVAKDIAADREKFSGYRALPTIIQASLTAAGDVNAAANTGVRSLGQWMSETRGDGPMGLLNTYTAAGAITLGMALAGGAEVQGAATSVVALPMIAAGHQLVSEAIDGKALTPEEATDMASHFVNEVLMPMGVDMARVHIEGVGLKARFVAAAPDLDPTGKLATAAREAMPHLAPADMVLPTLEVKPIESPKVIFVDPLKAPGDAVRTGTIVETVPHAVSPADLGTAPKLDSFKPGPDMTASGGDYTHAQAALDAHNELVAAVQAQADALEPSKTIDARVEKAQAMVDQVDQPLGKQLTDAGASPSESLQTIVKEALNRQTKGGLETRADIIKTLEAGSDRDQAKAAAMRDEDAARSPNDSIEKIATDAGADPATIELAKGYDAASAIYATFHDLMLNEVGGIANIFGGVQRAMNRAASMRDGVEALIRERTGLANQLIAKQFALIDGYRKQLEPHMPEYLAQLKLGPAGNVQNTVIYQFNAFMSGRSTGAQMDPNTGLHPVANALRTVMQNMEEQIKATYPDWAAKSVPGWTGVGNFQEDYLRNNWKKPGDWDAKFGSGKQGSTGGAFKQMTLGYMKGIDAGLEPKFPNPIDNAMQYVQSIASHLAAKQILDTAAADTKIGGMGAVKYVRQGTSAPDGWVKIDGLSSSKTVPYLRDGKPAAFNFNAYAPADFAKSYNNWVGATKLFDGNSPKYQAALYFSNAMTGIKLLIPTYHALAMASETSIASISTGFTELAHGEFGRGLKDLLSGGFVLPSIAETMARGIKNQREYLSDAGSGVSTLFAMAGGRVGGAISGKNPVGIQEPYRFGQGPSIWTSVSHGTLSSEIAQDFRHAFGADSETTVGAVLGTPGRLIGMAGKEMGRVLASGPGYLFSHVVPWLKQGAFGMEMDAFLRHNPTADMATKVKFARTLVDSMDNRFGEMNQDNLFWKAGAKQIANAVLISVGWEFGSLRAFANAANFNLDHPNPFGGAGNRPRMEYNPVAMRWMAAFVAGTAAQNMMYQYLKTGQGPMTGGTPLLNLSYPLSGGQTPEHKPERVAMPGYTKDAFAIAKVFMQAGWDPFKLAQNLAQLAGGKGNPAIKDAWMLGVSGTDAIGHKIALEPVRDSKTGRMRPNNGSFLDRANSYWHSVFLPSLEPIQFEQKRLKGTGISWYEQALGLHAAPTVFEDPVRTNKGLAGVDKRDAAQEWSRFKKDNSRSETPEKGVPAPGRAPSSGQPRTRQPSIFTPSRQSTTNHFYGRRNPYSLR